jgi:hypothetical protein
MAINLTTPVRTRTSKAALTSADPATTPQPAISQLDRARDTRSAAAFLGLSASNLTKRRLIDGTGPVFRKYGNSPNSRVVYLESDLIAWRDAQIRRSTSDNGSAAA